jgi:general secretion pathway protein G
MSRTATRRDRGFTLIEIMVAISVILILLGVAIPVYSHAITRKREENLRHNLDTLNRMIFQYTLDKQKAPQSLQDLVRDGYLHDVPRDPITQKNDSWKIIMEDAGQAVSSSEPGIFDIRSGSDKIGLDGTHYSEW